MLPSMNLPVSVASDSVLSLSAMGPTPVSAIVFGVGVVAAGMAAVSAVRRLRRAASALGVVGSTRARVGAS